MEYVPTTTPGTELPPTGRPKSRVKTLILWLLIFGAVVILWQISTAHPPELEISYNRFQELVGEGQVRQVTIRDRLVAGVLLESIDLRMDFRLVLPFDPDAAFVAELIGSGVTVYGDQMEDSPMLAIFLTWGPVLLIVALWVYFMKRYARRQNEMRDTEL